MKKFFGFFLFFVLTFLFSQERKNFTGVSAVLKSVQPDEKSDFWLLAHKEQGIDTVLKTVGNPLSFESPQSGFQMNGSDSGFYYIVYSRKGEVYFILNREDLKKFTGKPQNVEEAALAAMLSGFILDEEYKNLAGNFAEDAENYYVELGKVTSEHCPYQKTHYLLTINKITGQITEEKNRGIYVEVYDKSCANNPRLKFENPPIEPMKVKIKKPRVVPH